MAKFKPVIQSIFARPLASKAREMAEAGLIQIIPTKDFPEGAPIHEDGSSVYHPAKALVYFAVQLRTRAELDGWNAAIANLQHREAA
jgi:hypothetical protein